MVGNYLFIYLPVERFIDADHLPHLLLYGPPGTGKTSTILACARKLYSAKEFNSMVCFHGLCNVCVNSVQ